MNKKNHIIFFLTLMLCFTGNSLAYDFELGLYELNRGEFKAAIKEFTPLAAAGYSPAQYQLAMMYKNGQGLIADNKKALELLTLAAQQKDSDAQFELSVIYSKGELVKQDLKK